MYEHAWQVLQVNTNCEKKVAQHLAARSLEHYLPLYSERSRWSDRVVPLERPLFTGYVFVRFSLQARLSVVSTPGVLRLLGSDERDMVSAAEINRIREGLASGSLLRPHRGVSLGTRVRVRCGVFEGVEGVVTEMRRQCKVVVALAAIRQFFSLELEIGDVEVLKCAVVPPFQELQPARAK
ncbi:MAG: transcription termination/antitermination NusG family protein [Terracidiphilus sp.]